jgi:hypothetical protein
MSIGSYTLVRGKDFTVSGNTYTIKADYLATLSDGAHIIVFNMNGGTNPRVTVTVSGTEQTPVISGTVNGKQTELTPNTEGSVTHDLSTEEAASFPPVNNVYTIEIYGNKSIKINKSISSMNGYSALNVKTDSGTVTLPITVLEAYRALYGDTFEMLVQAGSLVVEFHNNGKAVNWNDPKNPMFITIPVKPAADTNANGYVAVKKEISGNTIIPYSVYKNGEVTFQTTSTGKFDVIYNGKSFSDTQGHWANGTILFIAARGIAGGMGDNQFNPDTSVTRAMFTQLLANIEGIDLSAYKTTRFTDVDLSAWYAPAIEWAAAMGIVGGYGDGIFAPDVEITREQMAAMLVNYARYKGYTLPSGQTTAFTDESSIAAWAYDAVKMIQAAGIVGGKPGNLFDPQGTATRAEMATIFANFIIVYINHALTSSSITTTAVNTGNANDNPDTGRGLIIYAVLPGKENEITATTGINDDFDETLN